MSRPSVTPEPCDKGDVRDRVSNLKDTSRLPYRYAKVKDEQYIVITKGERDADTLAALGIPATSGLAGKDPWPEEVVPLYIGKEIRIVYPVGQDRAALAVAKRFFAVTLHVFILRVPLPNQGDNITDFLSSFPDDYSRHEAFLGILADEQRYVPKLSDKDAPLSVMLSNVESKKVPWLWENFIPLGRATLLSGDPGSAKTWFCLDLASRLSRGFPWADGSPGNSPAQTIYLTVEDDIHDTIRPRVDTLGGDVSMIAAYNSEHPLHLNLNSREGLMRLEKEIRRLGNVRLVVIDPIIDFSGNVNPNAAEEVRALLIPLIRLAAQHNFALVLVGHLNKAQALSAIYRTGGTTSGWLGKCRVAFMVFRDVGDKSLRHVVALKANLARMDPSQLEFRINDGQLSIEVSSEEVDLDEQLNPQHSRNPREREDAVAWINDYFGGRNEITSNEIEEAARRAGISVSTLARAKQLAGFKSIKRRGGKGKPCWMWAKRKVA